MGVEENAGWNKLGELYVELSATLYDWISREGQRLTPWDRYSFNDIDGHLAALSSAVENGDMDGLPLVLPLVFEKVGELGIPVSTLKQRYQGVLDQFGVSEPTTLYIAPAAITEDSELLISVNRHLVERVAAAPWSVAELTPRQFEELIAEIFDRTGHEVHLTKRTRDGGYDIVAVRRALDIPVRYIVECKRYDPKRKVSLDIVQRLLGVKIATRANKAILVTTSSFTADAQRFADSHYWDLTLRDGEAVLQWIRELKEPSA
jgi:hypothetical protein